MTPLPSLVPLPSYLILFVLFSVSAATAADVALLIGEADYPEGCETDLPTSGTDVAGMKTALATAGWVVVDKIDQTKEQILQLVRDNVPAEDKFIFYYSGHGSGVTAGDLITTDCKKITPDELKGALGDARTRTFVILDSCLSGEFVQRLNEASPETCVLSATSPSMEQCADEGVFTDCVVEGMGDSNVDMNHDGKITMNELKNRIYSSCSSDTQEPYWDDGCPDWVLSHIEVTPTIANSWGQVKAGFSNQ